MTTSAVSKHVQLVLDERENFMLSAFYMIGLSYSACDEPAAQGIAREIVKILRGPKGRVAAFSLAEKMKKAAYASTKDDIERMALDP
jgi:hypothetical protein